MPPEEKIALEQDIIIEGGGIDKLYEVAAWKHQDSECRGKCGEG
jgi:hypothetical protein